MNLCVWIIVLHFFLRSYDCCNLADEKCKISRIHSMRAADCYDKEKVAIPKCLPKDIEILDLSHNRIRKISDKDLSRYSNLKILYLNDNLITVLDDEIFSDKLNLRTLDLSLNGITRLPHNLLNLPSLQTLYLGQNVNMNIVQMVEIAKPVKSPLVHIDISNQMTEEAGELPDFGLLPTLEKYNISGNKLKAISAKYFAGLCNLKILDTTNITIEYEGRITCDCWHTNTWLQSRNISFKIFPCLLDKSECNDTDISVSLLEQHRKCLEEFNNALKTSKKKILIISLSVLFIALIIVIGIIIKIKRSKKKKKNTQTEERILNISEHTASLYSFKKP